MSTIQITHADSKHEFIIKTLLTRTTGHGAYETKLPPTLVENRLELTPLPGENLSKIAMNYMKEFPEKEFPEMKYFNFSLHKIETYKDSSGKIYYSDTLVEELDSVAIVSLRNNLK